MDPLERAARLRQEADDVLRLVRLHEIVRPHGEVVPTGSYYLDVMMYPDIDVDVPSMSIPQLFQVAGQLAECAQVIQVVFERSDDPDLPGGLYLKPRVAYGAWGRPWKIDIWSMDAAVVAAHMTEMRRFKARLTPALRERIIRYKASILNRSGRTPMSSGYFIYKAILDEGLSDDAEVTRYLILHGIDMSG